MFEAAHFDHYTPDTLPLDSDVYLRDEGFMADYESAFNTGVVAGDFRQVGWVAFAAVRRVTPASLEVSVFVNIFDRFHELAVSLPRDQVICCVGAWKWDENPSIFVKAGWIEGIYRRANCVFAMIDAIDVRKAMEAGLGLHERLPHLRDGIDAIAARFPKVLFLSFADSLVLKSHWHAGFMGQKDVQVYDPESFLFIFREVRAVFREVLGLGVYGVITQGVNEYFNDGLLHVSGTGNHVCMNSLGAPFADLQTIERVARAAIKEGRHEKHELYLDELFFSSLRLRDHEAKSRRPRHPYTTALKRLPSNYVGAECDELLAGLTPEIASAGS